ncbi:MAG: fasciclin domain-containing protein [Candidatus Thermoplasmatota archaeon]|jgi:uncharacterized surface protein with fasciclin (FAS1) repeats|nr:fasciclin domain-containing protein [Candidatus Thermoplasmatota archaeon]
MDNIVEVAVKSGKFGTLVTAVKAAGLVDALSSAGPFTVFAPSEDAFKAVPKSTLDSLLQDKEKLGNLLKYHVVSGKYLAKDVLEALKSNKSVDIATLQGESVHISQQGTFKKIVKVNDANVTAADVMASNGVIHVIDKVIMPKKL